MIFFIMNRLNEDIGCVLLSGDSSPDNLKNAVQLCQKIEMDLENKKLLEKLQKYAKVMPLDPESFALENLETVLILNPKLKQYTLLGMNVYKKLDQEEKLIMNKYIEFYNIYRTFCANPENYSKSEDFEIIENIKDRIVGAKTLDGLLILCSQRPWEDKEKFKSSLKSLANIIKSDYDNIFISNLF